MFFYNPVLLQREWNVRSILKTKTLAHSSCGGFSYQESDGDCSLHRAYLFISVSNFQIFRKNDFLMSFSFVSDIFEIWKIFKISDFLKYFQNPKSMEEGTWELIRIPLRLVLIVTHMSIPNFQCRVTEYP